MVLPSVARVEHLDRRIRADTKAIACDLDAPLPLHDRNDDGGKSPSSSSSSSSSSPSSDGDIDDEPDDVACDVDAAPIYEAPDAIFGQRVKVEHHRDRKDVGLRISCCNADHANCRRYRSVFLWTERHGPGAAKVWLECWLNKSLSMSADRHRRFRPKLADVKAYLALDRMD